LTSAPESEVINLEKSPGSSGALNDSLALMRHHGVARISEEGNLLVRPPLQGIVPVEPPWLAVDRVFEGENTVRVELAKGRNEILQRDILVREPLLFCLRKLRREEDYTYSQVLVDIVGLHAPPILNSRPSGISAARSRVAYPEGDPLGELVQTQLLALVGVDVASVTRR
jgi:hypothetical protein